MYPLADSRTLGFPELRFPVHKCPRTPLVTWGLDFGKSRHRSKDIFFDVQNSLRIRKDPRILQVIFLYTREYGMWNVRVHRFVPSIWLMIIDDLIKCELSTVVTMPGLTFGLRIVRWQSQEEPRPMETVLYQKGFVRAKSVQE